MIFQSWWGELESNQHSVKRQIYSLLSSPMLSLPEYKRDANPASRQTQYNGVSSYDTFNKLVTNPAVVGIIQ